jgi:hypothetical protein
LLNSDRHNELGYFELAEVVAINEGLLAASGSTWNDPVPCHLEPPNPELLERMRAVVDKGQAHRVWALKDPRFCLTLPLWADVLGDCRVLVTVRNPIDVARSLEAAHGMGIKESITLWARYMYEVEEWALPVSGVARLSPLYIDYDWMLVRERRVRDMLAAKYPWLHNFENRYVLRRSLRHHRYSMLSLPWQVKTVYGRMQRYALSSLDDFESGRVPRLRWNPARNKWVYERRGVGAEDIQPPLEGSEGQTGLLDTDPPGRGVSPGVLREP